MSDPLGAIGSFLFGGSKTKSANLLSGGQQNLLDAISTGGVNAADNLYNTLGGLSSTPVSSYDALPDFEGQFQQQYGNPLKQQYEMDLANIQNSGELFSGGTMANNYRAMNNLNTQMASARANMIMQERERQRQSTESSLSRQLNASQLLSQLTQSPLGVKSKENIVEKTPGLLSMISGVANTVSNVAKMGSGLGGSGEGPV